MKPMQSPSLRGLTAGRPFAFVLPAVLALAVLAGEPGAQTDSTLRQLAASRGIYVGAAVTFPGGQNAANRPEYERVLRTEFNGVVAENDMKFQRLSPSRGEYNFAGADAIVEFAEANNMVIRGHTLVWHSQTANWFNNLSGAAASRDTTLKIMKQHIDTVAGRYRGKIYEWDVVNEAIAQNGGASPNYRTGGTSRWYDRVGGIDYIDSAFVWAHRADSNALLFYNDFGGETMNAKSQNIYDLVSGLKSRGIPIHGVGLQCHFNAGNVDTAAIGQNMRRLAALGLRISLTEIDIQTTNTTANLETQAANYKALMSLCISVPACKSYYAWGVNDAQSWRGANAVALLFTGTSTMTPKPAYHGVVEAIQAADPVAVWSVAPDRPGVLRAGPALRNGTVLFGDRDGMFDTRGRRLQSIPLPAK